MRRRRRVNAGDTVHLVNGGATSWFGFASEIFASEAIRQRVRAPHLIPIKTSEFPTRARRPANSHLSTEKARTVWKLHVPDWRESLAECLSRLQLAPFRRARNRPQSERCRLLPNSPRTELRP